MDCNEKYYDGNSGPDGNRHCDVYRYTGKNAAGIKGTLLAAQHVITAGDMHTMTVMLSAGYIMDREP